MKQITKIRKAVCAMANELVKLGYTLSKAFKTAWTRAKEGMTVKAAGVTFGNRQSLLQYILDSRLKNLKLK